MVLQVKDMTYGERLKALDLPSLKLTSIPTKNTLLKQTFNTG